MMNDRGVILWDFDGTLAHRNGFFSEVLLQVLDDNEPQHSVRVDDIRPFLRDGFPWHFPENPHFDLTDPVAWWAFVERSFVRAFEGLGLPKEKAAEYSRQYHTRYIDPDGFDLYSDTEETLQSFLNMGWRHAILSNHVPELPAIGRELGLDRYVCECISSANVGYEKPNPAIFQLAIERVGNPSCVWMVGDSYTADVIGARRAGIPAVQVRSVPHDDAEHYARELVDVIPIINS